MAKVSIVTASFRSAATITDTLRSLNIQTYPDIEHIVVDGGSNDETMAIVEREGRRVARAVSERDKGIYDAYNKGLRLVSGEIIGFLNSDDFYCSPTVIEKVARAFADRTVEAVYADLVYVDKDDTNRIIRHWKSAPYRPGVFKNAFVPAHPTLFLRKSVYDRVGGFDLRYRLAADYEFMLRTFHTHGVKSVYIPEIIVKMREGGATGASVRSIMRQNAEIMQAHRQHEVGISRVNFMARKLADRAAQRIRGRLIRADSVGALP